MTAKSSGLVDVGRITTVFGIKGWVKVRSYTEPVENLFQYAPWWLKTPHGAKEIEIDDFRPHGKGFVAHIKGIDDCDVAAKFTALDIAVERNLLATLDDGEYYWHQLTGLNVISRFEGQEICLGQVSKLMETGANDVLVVMPTVESIDQRERLIPYIPEQFVLDIDLSASIMLVDWDPGF